MIERSHHHGCVETPVVTPDEIATVVDPLEVQVARNDSLFRTQIALEPLDAVFQDVSVPPFEQPSLLRSE